MAQITFKAKIRNGFIDVPTFKRSHCDMPAFLSHPKYGAIANSDLFPNALARIRRDTIGSDHKQWLKTTNLPPNVTLKDAGFLATVTIDV